MHVFAGDIFTIPGLDCASGDTFVTDSKLSDLSMENIFVPKPVVSLSIKPKNPKQADNFSKAINRFQKEDPTFVCHRYQHSCNILFCLSFDVTEYN